MKPANTRQPLVSVIMPTFNQAQFIGGAIKSVLEQAYGNLELVIVDNYSSDGTESVIASFKDARIKYLKFSNKGVIAASRNAGVNSSLGEYLAFLDSDDNWHKEKLEKQLPHLSEAGIIGVGSDIVYKSDTFYKNTGMGKTGKGYRDYGYNAILKNNPVATSSVLIKKCDFSAAGGFDEDVKFRFIEDWELWLRLARKGSFRIIGYPPIVYRIYPTSRDRIDVIKRKLEVIAKQAKLGYITEPEKKEAESGIYFYLACKLFPAARAESGEFFLKALETSRTFIIKLKSCAGLLAVKLPAGVRKLIFAFLQRVNRMLKYL